MRTERTAGSAQALDPGVETLLEGTRYRATGLLGRGGQGLVVDAVHEILGKPVVIKVPHGAHATEPRLLDRMHLEAQALARLSSPHLVAVHDIGTLRDGRPFVVMDRLWGRTLKAEVREHGPVPVVEAIRIARQVLVALGVVHRAPPGEAAGRAVRERRRGRRRARRRELRGRIHPDDQAPGAPCVRHRATRRRDRPPASQQHPPLGTEGGAARS